MLRREDKSLAVFRPRSFYLLATSNYGFDDDF